MNEEVISPNDEMLRQSKSLSLRQTNQKTMMLKTAHLNHIYL